MNELVTTILSPKACLDNNLPDHIFMGPGCSQYGYDVGNGVHFGPPGFTSAVFSNGRSCFMGKDMLQPSFDYLKSWIRVYKGKRKLFLFRTCQVHNFYGEEGHNLDEMLEDFLRDALADTGSKNPNMVIRIYADHGDHQHMFRNTTSGDFERHMPLMMNVIPKSIVNNNPEGFEKFKQNTHRLTTPVDFFWTDMGLIGGKMGVDGSPADFGWLVRKIREERTKLKASQPRFKNLGADLFNEEVDK